VNRYCLQAVSKGTSGLPPPHPQSSSLSLSQNINFEINDAFNAESSTDISTTNSTSTLVHNSSKKRKYPTLSNTSIFGTTTVKGRSERLQRSRTAVGSASASSSRPSGGVDAGPVSALKSPSVGMGEGEGGLNEMGLSRGCGMFSFVCYG